jgi:hypothetical protein
MTIDTEALFDGDKPFRHKVNYMFSCEHLIFRILTIVMIEIINWESLDEYI